MGPPHIFIAMAAVHKLLEVVVDSQDKQLILKWWKEKVEGKNVEQVGDSVRIWRCRKPQKSSVVKGMKEGYAKLSMAVCPELGEPLSRILLAAGAVRKVGKAPRSWLEREASTLLNKFQKKNWALRRLWLWLTGRLWLWQAGVGVVLWQAGVWWLGLAWHRL